MPTYKGSYRVKNKSKYRGNANDITYRSHWEKNVMIWLDNNSDVKEWSSEEVVIPYFYEVDRRNHRYFIDFYIKWKSNKVTLVEVKPAKQLNPPVKGRGTSQKRYLNEASAFVMNMNKWEAANKFAKKNGWEFVIWTEKELSSLGILKKSPGKIKKLKPMAPYRKKKK